MNQGAAAVTQKLDQLININLRIEKLMEKGQAADRSKNDKKDGVSGASESKTNAEDIQNLSSLATAMTPLIDAINKSGGVDKDLGKNIAKIIVDISEGIKEAANNVKIEEVNSITKMLEVVTGGAGKFMMQMALVAVIAPISFIGAMLFSATIAVMTNILAKSATLAPETTDGIQAVLDMAKGAALFGLAMIFYSVAGPVIALGALAFVLIVRGISAVLSQAATLAPETTDGIQAVLNMAKGAALFGLAMILYSMVAPQIAMGALVFILVVGAMLMVFGLINKSIGPIDSGLVSLNKIAMGAALFVLTFIIASYFATQIAIGALVTILAIAGMVAAFALINKFIGPIDAGLLSLNKIAMGAAIFVLTFIVASYFAKEIAVGALVTILAIAGMIFVLNLVGKKLTTAKVAAQVLQDIAKPIAILMAVFIATGYFAKEAVVGALVTILAIGGLVLVLKLVSNNIKSTKTAAQVLQDIAKPIAILMAVFIATGYFAKEAMIGAVITSLAIGLISAVTYGVGKFKKDISAGGKVLNELIIPLLAFTAAIFVWSTIKDWDNVLKGGIAVAAAIVVLGLAAYALGLPAVAPFATIGAGVLIVLAGALLIFSVALLILSKVKVTEAWADSISYAFIEIGKAAALMGFMSPLIVLGAIAMLALAGPLILLSFSLAAFKKVKFTKKDGDDISHAISSVIEGFANTSILDALDAAATAQLVDVMSDGIIKLSSGLTDFKKVKYTEKDGVLIKDAIKSVVTAFSDAFEDLTFTKWMQITAGIDMLTKMGSAIAALAEGVGRMANLEVVEYEVINKGTPDQKLVAKGSRKLKRSDFKAASDNIKAILGIDDNGEYGLINTLTAFGKAVDQGSNWFSNGYIETGLDMFTKLSSSLGNLAEGVAKMASLEVVTMKVIAPGTKDAKLVPDATIKLNDTHFKAAAENIKAILGIKGDGNGLIDVLTGFGRSMTAGEGIFSGGYIEKGIDGLAKISGSLSNLAEGVYKMATLEIRPMEVIAPGTKDAQLVFAKGNPIILGPDHFKAAGENIGKILTALVDPLDKFGREMDGYFSGYVGKGIEGIASLSSPLADLADLIIKIGGGQIEQKVVYTDPKTGAPTLVPGKLINFSTALVLAKASLSDMLNFLPNQLLIFSKKYETISSSIESGLAGIDTMRAGLEDNVVPSIEMMAKAIEIYLKANETLSKLKTFKISPEDTIINFVNKMATLQGSTVALTMSEIVVPAMDDFLIVADKYSQGTEILSNLKELKISPEDIIINFINKMSSLKGSTVAQTISNSVIPAIDMMSKALETYLKFKVIISKLQEFTISPEDTIIKFVNKLENLKGSTVISTMSNIVVPSVEMLSKALDIYIKSKVILSKLQEFTISPENVIINFVNKVAALQGSTVALTMSKIVIPTVEMMAKAIETYLKSKELLFKLKEFTISPEDVIINFVNKLKTLNGNTVALTMSKSVVPAVDMMSTAIETYLKSKGRLFKLKEYTISPEDTIINFVNKVATLQNSAITLTMSSIVIPAVEMMSTAIKTYVKSKEVLAKLKGFLSPEDTIINFVNKLDTLSGSNAALTISNSVIPAIDMMSKALETYLKSKVIISKLQEFTISPEDTIINFVNKMKTLDGSTVALNMTKSVILALEMMVKAIETYIKSNELLSKLKEFTISPENVIVNFVNKMKTLNGSTVSLTMSEIVVPAVEMMAKALDTYLKSKELLPKLQEFTISPEDTIINFVNKMATLNGSTVALTMFKTIIPSIEMMSKAIETYLKSNELLAKLKEFTISPEDTIINFVNKLKTLEGNTVALTMSKTIIPAVDMMSKAIETYLKSRELLSKLKEFTISPEDTIINFVNKMVTLNGSTVALTMSEIIVPAMVDFLSAAKKYSQATEIFASTSQYAQKPEEMIIAFSSSMDKLGLTISTRMNDKTLKQFTTFNTQMTRLAMISSPFERFVKSFGDMAKHMGLFAKNFNVMDANGIMAFKDWTESMVLISKVDVNKSAAIIDFVNKIVDGAFGAGTPSSSNEKSPQGYSTADKKAAVNSQNDKAIAAGRMPAPQQQKVSIDTTGIEAAIKNAFLNLNIETLRTGKIIQDS